MSQIVTTCPDARERARKSPLLLLLLVVVSTFVPLGARVAAQAGVLHPGEGMTASDILKRELVDDAVVNSSSSLIAVVVQRARRAGEPLMTEGYYRGNIRADVVVFSATTGEVVMRTQGAAEHAGYWHPAWSPRGRRLAMLKLHGDTLSVCIWHESDSTFACRPRNRSVDYLTQLSIGITPQGSGSLGRPFLWLSDSVLAMALLPDGHVDKFALASHRLADSISATWARSESGMQASVSVIDTPQPTANRESFGEIVLWNVVERSSRPALSFPYFDQGFRDVVFSPNHDRVAILADQYRTPSSQAIRPGFHNRTRKELGVAKLAGDTTVTWYPRHPYTRFVRWAQSGDRFGVMVKRDDDDDEVTGTGLVVVDPVLTTARSITSDGDATSSLRWSAKLAPTIRIPGQFVSAPRSDGGPKTDNAAQLDLAPSDRLLALAPDGRFAVVRRLIRNTTKINQEFFNLAQPRLLLSLNSYLANVASTSRMLITYTARDGSEQRGVVILPPGYQPERHYPLVVWVYPGDLYTDTLSGSWLRSGANPLTASLDPNLLAARGYAVLLPSMPLVPDGVAGEPYAHMLDGVDPAIDTLIARGIADSSRLGIMGHSYGGYAVNCIVSQSHRFRAAVSSAGMADLTSAALQFYPPSQFTDLPVVELALMETGQGRMGNPPWRDPERYMRNSPITYSDSVHTPVLITAGDNDFVDQAEEWFTALGRAGKRARLVVYRGEGHLLLSPANIEHFWREVLAWFDTYLGASTGQASAGIATGTSYSR